MTVEKHNGDPVKFLKQKDYTMVNNNLGSGSFGKTVLLKDPFINELFVCKKYEPDPGIDKKQFYNNFLDEIKIMYKLNHKNIVRIYNYYSYEDDFTGYILMEYIEGKNLASFINEYFSGFAITSLDDIFIQLIDAFCYMEENCIIHRDIRESNILVDKNGIVKVIDFGIGKIFTNQIEQKDSLAGDINRASSDTFPKEYYDGTYTNLTDMFYLAELLRRLIKNANSCDERDFTYWNVLNIMMEKEPENRYKSFAEIRNDIGKHNFNFMTVSEHDKYVYKNFTDSLCTAVISYRSEQRFNTDPISLISKFSRAIELNALETYFKNNSDVIKCVVLCDFEYITRELIKVSAAKDFLDWFSNSTKETQALILTNFIHKLSQIPVVRPEEELPY